jgi:hypothetical protein
MPQTEICPICNDATASEIGITSKQTLGAFQICECPSCSHRFIVRPPDEDRLRSLCDEIFRSDTRQPRNGMALIPFGRPLALFQLRVTGYRVRPSRLESVFKSMGGAEPTDFKAARVCGVGAPLPDDGGDCAILIRKTSPRRSSLCLVSEDSGVK